MDMQENLAILNMIHEKVKIVGDRFFVCEDGKKLSIINEFGAEVISSENASISIIGNFVIVTGTDNAGEINREIYNLDTQCKGEIKQSKNYGYSSISRYSREVDLGEFLGSINNDGLDIYSKYAEKIAFIPNCNSAGIISQTSCYSSVWYTIDYIPKYRHALLSKQSNELIYYDIIELDNGMQLIASEVANIRFNISDEVSDRYRYKLGRYNKILTEKAYDDIIKLPDIYNEELYYTVYIDKHKNKKFGVINYNGDELVEPIYDKIENIGSGNFRLEVDSKALIYNVIKNTKSNVYNSSNVIIHKTLPITIIVKNDDVILLKSTGELFSIKDFTKHFKCSISDSDLSLIKVELDYGTKYIDNRLSPITNMHKIAAISKYEWKKLY